MSLPPRADKKQRRVAGLRLLTVIAAFAALVSLGLEYGFDRPPLPVALLISIQIAAVTAYVVLVIASLLGAPSWIAAVKGRWPDIVLILVGALLLLGYFEAARVRALTVSTVYVGAIQVLLVLRFCAGVVRWNLEMSQRQLHPSRLLVASFVVVIVVGSLLLCLPKAVSPALRAESGHYLGARIVKSFFTATSATCVTGLVVYDTGADFTRFGQVVILILIQLGGLGIMISSTLMGLLIGKQLSLRRSLVLQDALSRQTVGRMGSVIRFIVLTTFACEAVGALLCYPMFATTVDPLGERIFHCVFHAVSAFCNAGFALQSDSLIAYGASWGLYVSIMPLIVLGGLGFPVLEDLGRWLASKLARVPRTAPAGAEGLRSARPRRGRGKRYRINLHTKLVLSSTVLLIVVPAVLLFVVESIEWRSSSQRDGAALPAQMIELPVWERAGAALFQSVTARTAGFNTVGTDDRAMSSASHFLLMLLMFVGGSPASTAGGVKTVAVTVLVLGVFSTLWRRGRVEAFGRSIPREIVDRAAVVVVVMLAVVSAAVLALCVTESGTMREILFEAVSACGTVGLSAGLTERLTTAGQIIIMLAMFAGRLGPLTIMIALAGKQSPARFEYPAEKVTIG